MARTIWYCAAPWLLAISSVVPLLLEGLFPRSPLDREDWQVGFFFLFLAALVVAAALLVRSAIDLIRRQRPIRRNAIIIFSSSAFFVAIWILAILSIQV